MLLFFIPLAIQAASMSLSYLFVATIVTHGPGGTDEYAAFSQGLSVLWVLAALGQGLPTTAMVFCKSVSNIASFERMNWRLMFATNALQILCCLPFFDKILFGKILGLDAALLPMARTTLLLCVPVQMCFYRRNMYLARLLIEKRSGAANLATMARIALSVALSPLFVKLGLCGHRWGVVAMTLPVMLELFLTRQFALPGLKSLGDPPEVEKASAWEQLRFTIPLSFGGLMLATSGFMTGFFLGHLPDAASVLSVHYIMLGVVNPVAFAALRMQSVTIAFADETDGGRQVLPFAAAVGAVFSAVTLVGQIPFLATWYFGYVQNLASDLIPAASRAMLVAMPIPLLQALRGQAEGLAAVRRRPNAILTGQALYLATLVCVLALTGRSTLIAGSSQGAFAMTLAIGTALITTRIALLAGKHERHLHLGQFGTGILRSRR